MSKKHDSSYRVTLQHRISRVFIQKQTHSSYSFMAASHFRTNDIHISHIMLNTKGCSMFLHWYYKNISMWMLAVKA